MSTLSWVDFDGDGDPDLTVTGFTNQVPSFRMFRNRVAVSNSPPTIPHALNVVSGGGGSVDLRWDASTDANQSGGLTYNVRVGRAPGSVDVVAPEADLATGHLRVPRRGNASSLLHLPLTNLVAGSYWWSVQAVDHGFASSAFADEMGFVIPPGPPRLRGFAISDLRYQHASLSAEVLPDGSLTRVWFEFGADTAYGSVTSPLDVGDGVA